ncbi:MAG: STAS domain-containing protein [Chloroflexi bacterium]|nr:STAS domain-containing protein [Chloroflexota bacterium]
MQVPILKQGAYLIAVVQSALTDNDLIQLRENLLSKVGQYRSRGVILDLTTVDVMDSFATRTVRDISQMIRLRGAETVIVGIQPEVAFAMVQLGLSLEGVATALDFEEGIQFLDKKVGASPAVSQDNRALPIRGERFPGPGQMAE